MTPKALVETVMALDPLADLPRTGWVIRGVPQPESIAAHSHAVGLVAMWLVDMLRAAGQTVDGELTLRMALLHDAAEAVTGDVPMPNKTPEMDAALHALESAIVARTLPATCAEVWTEAETSERLEARIVRAADKIQMMIKVVIYERTRGASLDEFWLNAGNFRTAGIEATRAVYEVIAALAGREIPGFDGAKTG